MVMQKGRLVPSKYGITQLTKAIVMISTTQHELIKGSHVYVFESATAECEVHKCQLSSDDVEVYNSMVMHIADARNYYRELRADGFMPVSLLT